MRYLVFVIVVALTEGVNSLRCFDCTSSDKNGCHGARTSKTCGADYDVCYTMSHVTEVRRLNMTVQKHGQLKGCAKKNTCEESCLWYRENNHDCEVKCCCGNHCNIKPVVVVPTKKKRKSIDTSKSPHTLTISNIHLLALLFLTWMKLYSI